MKILTAFIFVHKGQKLVNIDPMLSNEKVFTIKLKRTVIPRIIFEDIEFSIDTEQFTRKVET